MKGILSLASMGIPIAFLTVMACNPTSESPLSSKGPDPLATVRKLLELHELVGRQPEERSLETRKKDVDLKALGELFEDFDGKDPFLRDVYIGFVVGVLARNQGRLFVSRQGNRAEISAGKAKVVLRRDNSQFRIVLKESVPKEIVTRANEEKDRFKEAKERASKNLSR